MGIRNFFLFKRINFNIFEIIINFRNRRKNIKIFLLFILSIIFLFCHFFEIFKINYNNNIFLDLKYANIIKNLNIENSNFAVIRRAFCPVCGLFSNYIVFLGCINEFLHKGFIPIIDLKSYENVFNDFKANKSNENPWEFFFYQPFDYKLKKIEKIAKKMQYFECNTNNFRPCENIFLNKKILNFWHIMSKNYIPIQNKILLEAKNIYKRLFKDSHNILGILMRGTDYIAKKPSGHPIPPNSSMVIKDIKNMNLKNNYDWLFISTEDDSIRVIFIKEFGHKLKFLFYKQIKYNYKNHEFLSLNKNIRGNLKYLKIYLINIIILSKCIDILSANTSGAIGVFILSNGFRYSKVYDLGYYT